MNPVAKLSSITVADVWTTKAVEKLGVRGRGGRLTLNCHTWHEVVMQRL